MTDFPPCGNKMSASDTNQVLDHGSGYNPPTCESSHSELDATKSSPWIVLTEQPTPTAPNETGIHEDLEMISVKIQEVMEKIRKNNAPAETPSVTSVDAETHKLLNMMSSKIQDMTETMHKANLEVKESDSSRQAYAESVPGSGSPSPSTAEPANLFCDGPTADAHLDRVFQTLELALSVAKENRVVFEAITSVSKQLFDFEEPIKDDYLLSEFIGRTYRSWREGQEGNENDK